MLLSRAHSFGRLPLSCRARMQRSRHEMVEHMDAFEFVKRASSLWRRCPYPPVASPRCLRWPKSSNLSKVVLPTGAANATSDG